MDRCVTRQVEEVLPMATDKAVVTVREVGREATALGRDSMRGSGSIHLLAGVIRVPVAGAGLQTGTGIIKLKEGLVEGIAEADIKETECEISFYMCDIYIRITS